ncbi:hypothetical protein [Selenomonas sp. AE3005]|uniref:hypothetical protein n=1 Tax=Selenomonas sp. AE3005 TaxID=1485543 RepID=UPI0025FB4C2D|nr:hypothetical protein [Selenomonas sp. AE3005]
MANLDIFGKVNTEDLIEMLKDTSGLPADLREGSRAMAEVLSNMSLEQQPQNTFTPGLLGETPASTQPSTPVNANASAENILTSMQNKNQANTQNMMETGQQGIQTAMQASQGLQAQRQSAMDATAQQAAQALQQQQQSEAGLGRFIGGLLNKFLIPVKFGGGRK